MRSTGSANKTTSTAKIGPTGPIFGRADRLFASAESPARSGSSAAVLLVATMSPPERRAVPRVGFPVLVLFRSQATEAYESAYGADLSVSGIRVEGARADVGAMLDLQLVERHGRRPVEVLGEVVRIDETGFSVRFVELDDAQRRWLSSVVSGRRAAPPSAETEDLLEAGFEELD